VTPVFLQQEPIQGGSSQDLLRAAAAIVVFTFVADGSGTRIDYHLQILLGPFGLEVYVYDDPEQCPCLGGDVHQQPQWVPEANNFAAVVATDL
jgi:hypothetical protein